MSIFLSMTRKTIMVITLSPEILFLFFYSSIQKSARLSHMSHFSQINVYTPPLFSNLFKRSLPKIISFHFKACLRLFLRLCFRVMPLIFFQRNHWIVCFSIYSSQNFRGGTSWQKMIKIMHGALHTAHLLQPSTWHFTY